RRDDGPYRRHGWWGIAEASSPDVPRDGGNGLRRSLEAGTPAGGADHEGRARRRANRFTGPRPAVGGSARRGPREDGGPDGRRRAGARALRAQEPLAPGD